jgi:c-di-GMP-binding flagellar brake protein YcgR
MQFVHGQLIVILAPFMDYEIYASVKQFDKDTLVLETKTSTDLPVSKDILCIAVEDNNMFEFYSQIDIKEDNLIFIKKPQTNQLNVIEKRNFNRIDCNIGYIASPISINNKSILNSDKKFTGTIRNISGGGILAETSLNLPAGMVFSFKLKLNFFIDCKVKVIRTIATDDGIYHSGCQFIDMDLESIKAISLFGFKEQLKKKQKDLNNSKMTKGGKGKNHE